jgi:hypothetical protein
LECRVLDAGGEPLLVVWHPRNRRDRGRR